MTLTPYSDAQMAHKYDAMWIVSRRLLEDGAVAPSALPREGQDELALSLIAPANQFDTQVLQMIERIQKDLAKVDPAHYFYPVPTLHITLLGCTPFFVTSVALDPRKALVDKIARTIFDEWHHPVRLSICGVNASRYSVFFQVHTLDESFFCLRKRLLLAFREAQQDPIEPWDDREIHMNIMKFSHCDRYRLRLLIPAIENIRHAAIGTVKLSRFQLVVADRLNSSANIVRTFTHKTTI